MTDGKNASDRRAFHPQLGNAMIFAPLRDGKTVPAVIDALPNDGAFSFANDEERYEVRRSIEAAIKRANETIKALRAMSTAATGRRWSAEQRAAAAAAVLEEIERTKLGMQADYMASMPSLFARAANTVRVLEALLVRSGVSRKAGEGS